MQGSSWRTHPRLFCFARHTLGGVVFMCAIACNHWRWHQEGKSFRVLSFCSLAQSIKMRAWDTEMLEKWTQPSQTHTQTTIGWQPDALAVSTSNWLIEAIKPQRQRALLKPLLPAATDLHPSNFPSSIHQVISPSIHCFLIHTSIPRSQHVYPSISHQPLLLWVWCLANGQAQSLVCTLCLPRPVGTAPVKHASLLWGFNCISSTHSTGWSHNSREGLLKRCPFY